MPIFMKGSEEAKKRMEYVRSQRKPKIEMPEVQIIDNPAPLAPVVTGKGSQEAKDKMSYVRSHRKTKE